MRRDQLLVASGLAMALGFVGLAGFVFRYWCGGYLGLCLSVTCVIQITLLITQRCPVCGKSLYVREGLPLETAGGLLTLSFLALPEARCSRCQRRSG